MQYLLTLLLLTSTLTVSAQTKSIQQSPPLSQAKPESVGMSSERLAWIDAMCKADPQEELIGILMKQTRDQSSDNTGWKFRLLVNQAVDD
ncbi:MAG: hypothetical protein AAF632_02395 [Bacteroidota bacterium]